MNSKFLFSVLVILFLQNRDCYGGKGFAGGVGQINQLRFQLIAAQLQISTSLKAANSTIQNGIALKQDLLDQELSASQNKGQEAGNSPSPVSHQCSEQHANSLSEINSDSLDDCNQELELQAIEAKTTLLHTLHAQISTVYVLCPFWPPSPNRAQCIQDFSEGITTQITDLVEDISSDIDDIVNDAQSCIEDGYQNARDVITNADNELQECLA